MTEEITCSDLQLAMRTFCERNGIEVIEKPTSISCEMPTTVQLRIFNKTRKYDTYTLYGIAFYPYRKIRRAVYFDTKGAIYLKQKFDKQNKQSETKEE
jgi:hypothetical protein